jgi:hypothetical protein
MPINLTIRDVLVSFEKSGKMRYHTSLDQLGETLLYRWPHDHRGKEWLDAQKICLECMEGSREPEQARAAFLVAAQAAGLGIVMEEYIPVRPEPRSKRSKRRSPELTKD